MLSKLLKPEYKINYQKNWQMYDTVNAFHRTRCQYSKRTKRWRPVKILKPKEYKYIPDLIKTVFEERALSGGNVNRVVGLAAEDPRNIARNIASVPRPTIKSLIQSQDSLSIAVGY